MTTLSHERVWAAIDRLAERHSLTPSGLARRSGLDPTTFNKSKRFASDGRARWPSTESIAKVIEATGASIDEFMVLLDGPPDIALDMGGALPRQPNSFVPLLGAAQAGAGGFFDDGGYPVGQGWDLVEFPAGSEEGCYALRVNGDSMQPLYRDGDVIIVSPGVSIRPGDRVVLKTRAGEVMAKVLASLNTRRIELCSLNPDHPNRTFDPAEIEWIARIIWASQ
jgi:phage repressor protein C with HTH and peptisase S24 domain